ncbi:MAG: metallophosphoesterase family protein [Syntrophales bacterium]|nr:metallophosphoesterase family protein [Syntrophales bacterium]
MKLGVISDTHLKARDEWLEQIVTDYFQDVDAVLHAGDIVDGGVLEVFAHKEVVAVCGNMDPYPLRNTLPSKLVMEIKGHRIGLIHGWGGPAGIEERIIGEFDRVDCVVFGHTHAAQVEYFGKVLFFNPGSPTDKRFAKETSLGILEIGKTIEGTIISLEASRGK